MQHYTEVFGNNIIHAWLVLTLKLVHSIHSFAKSALSITIRIVYFANECILQIGANRFISMLKLK